jgi:predicted alpha/beta hydrolase
MARIDEDTLIAADDTRLGARWTVGDGRATVVLAGATGVPQAFYRAWATDLADRGYDVLTFDYRGIGTSRRGSLRDCAATMADWGRLDLQAALDRASDRAGGRPVLFVGHSFGGQALGLVTGAERLAGGLTVGAQLGYWGWWPAPQRWGYAAIWALVPVFCAVFGYLPGRIGVGEDLPAGVAREWARWCRSPGYLLDHVPGARERFGAVRAPIDVFAIADDPYAPEEAVRAYARCLPRARVRRWTPAEAGLDRIGHFGFFRPAARRLWDEAAAVLDLAVDAAARRTA